MSGDVSGQKNLSSRRAEKSSSVDLAKPGYIRELPERGRDPFVYMVSTLAATEVPPAEQIKRTGSRHRLYSFEAVAKNVEESDKRIDEVVAAGCHVFLDSGAFTFQGKWLKATKKQVRSYGMLASLEKEREEFQTKYVEYCKRAGHKFACYANFDWKMESAFVYQLQKDLESRGIYPLPTIHGDDGLRWMERYIDDGHRFLAISRGPGRVGNQRKLLRYLESVFNIAEKRGVLLHGFAITNSDLMLRFPFYSCDSSTWIQARAVGNILLVQNGRVIGLHVTGHAKARDLQWAQTVVSGHGFDFESMCYRGEDKERNRVAWQQRGLWNMFVMANMRKLGARASGEEKTWKRLL